MNARILLALAVNAILVKAADNAEDTSMLGEIITSLGLESLESDVPQIASILADTALLSSLIDEIEPWELSSFEAELEGSSGTAVFQELSSIIDGLDTVGVNEETPTFATYVITSGSVTYTSYSAGIVTGSGRKGSSIPSKTASDTGSNALSGAESNALSATGAKALSATEAKALSGGGSKTSSGSSSESSSSSSKSKGVAAGLAAPVAVAMGAVGLALL